MTICESEVGALSALVKRVAEEYDDVDDAIAAAKAEIQIPIAWKGDPVWDDFVCHTYERGLREMIHDCRHQQRTVAKNGSQPSAERVQRPCRYSGHPEAIAALAKVSKRTILDTFMVGNKKLGDVYRDELADWGEREGRIGRGHICNQTFAREVVSRMPQNCRVREGHTAEAVEKLKQLAWGDE